MRMLRSMIAFAALACAATLATAAPAAPPLEPELAHAVSVVRDAVAPTEVMVAPALVSIDEPGAVVLRSTSGRTALASASATSLVAIAHRVHVDPGRASA